MKKIYGVIITMLFILLFSGCGEDGTILNDDTMIDDSTSTSVSVIPEQSEGMGLDYDISTYLFPEATLANGTFYKNYLVTNGQSITVEHYLEGSTDSLNDKHVTKFQDDKRIETSEISPNFITVYTIDENNDVQSQEQYPRLIRVNEDLLRNENGACVLKERIENLSTSEIVPRQANTEFDAQYPSVLHFYCGTSDGTKIDRYYADGWGEVVSIYTFSDGSEQYSVFDKNTDQNP